MRAYRRGSPRAAPKAAAGAISTMATTCDQCAPFASKIIDRKATTTIAIPTDCPTRNPAMRAATNPPSSANAIPTTAVSAINQIGCKACGSRLVARKNKIDDTAEIP